MLDLEGPAAPHLPSVTVIVPVRDEAAFIKRSLKSILSQDYPSNRMQVIVADGMSSDGTRAVVEREQFGHPNLYLIENSGRTAPAGLNAGLRRASGEIIVRVDGHCEIDRDYVSRCVAHLQSGECDAVGGSVTTVGENALADTIACAMSSPFGVGGSAFRTRRGETLLVDTVPFPAYTRAILDAVGPFDEEQVRNQDDEYNYRLRKRGGRVLLAADVHSRYYSRGSWRALWRQYFQYGFWKVRVLQKHPRQMKLRQFVPGLFVGALAVCAAGAPAWGWGRVGGLALLGAYGIAVVLATAWASRGQSARLWPMLPVAFVVLHIAYGTGFWTGIVRFWDRWIPGQTSRESTKET